MHLSYLNYYLLIAVLFVPISTAVAYLLHKNKIANFVPGAVLPDTNLVFKPNWVSIVTSAIFWPLTIFFDYLGFAFDSVHRRHHHLNSKHAHKTLPVQQHMAHVSLLR